MKFAPKTANEIQAESNRRNVWPKGVYDFEVVNASDEVSKSGNEMIKLQLKVYDAGGNSQMVWDYLLEAMAEKLMHACEAFGLNYDAGDLDASDFAGRAGQVVLYIQKAQNGYPEKNAVADYVRPKGEKQMAAASQPPQWRQPANQDLDDSIPF